MFGLSKRLALKFGGLGPSKFILLPGLRLLGAPNDPNGRGGPRSRDGRITGFGSRPGPVFLGLLIEFLSADEGILGEVFLPEYFGGGA